MKYSLSLLTLLAVPLFTLHHAVDGQSVNPDTRLQQLQQLGPLIDRHDVETLKPADATSMESESGELSDLGEQRILITEKTPTPWRIIANTDFIYTDNAFLTKGNLVDDVYFAGSLGVAYDWKVNHAFNLNVMLRQQMFRYFDHSVLDFDYGTLSTKASWITPKSLGNIILWGGWQWNRLTSARSNPSGISFGDEFLRYHTLSLGAQKLFFIDPYQYVFTGISAQFGFTEKSRSRKAFDPEKDTYTFFLGYHYDYSRSLAARIGYYLDRNLYTHIRTASSKHRRDWNHTIAATAIWDFNTVFSTSLSLSYTWNDSNERFYRYDVGSLGLGLRANYRF